MSNSTPTQPHPSTVPADRSQRATAQLEAGAVELEAQAAEFARWIGDRGGYQPDPQSYEAGYRAALVAVRRGLLADAEHLRHLATIPLDRPQP